MQIDEKMLNELRADPLGRTLKLAKDVLQEMEEYAGNGEWSQYEYNMLVETTALVLELHNAGLLAFPHPLGVPAVTGDRGSDCQTLKAFVRDVEIACEGVSNKARFASLRTAFAASLGNGFSYEFSVGDLERVQRLVNELRDLVREAAGLEDEHRQRVLARLEKLQAELHKKMSDLDRFWGLIGDAGVALGKLGKDAKPIVDLIRDLTSIVWNTQARAEELPSGTQPPLLGHDDVADR